MALAALFLDLATGKIVTGTGGGGTPGGSNKAVQVNDSGTFNGDATNFNFDLVKKFFGVQVAAPEAPDHAAGIFGQTVAAPATLSAVLVPEVIVDSPVSASAAQISAPAAPGAPSITGFNYIDYVYDAGSFSVSENGYQGSGFTCYGQTVSGYIFAYRMVDGVRVRNPFGQYFQQTDSIADGVSFWTINLSNWAVPNGFYDGFVIEFSDPYSGSYLRDIGNTFSCVLDNTGYSDTYVTSAYQSTGTNYSANLASYNNVNGTNYRSDYINGSNTDAGYGGSIYLIIQSTFSAGNNYFNSYNNGFFDVTGLSSFNDYGQSGSGDLSAFSSISFPNFNTSLTGCSSTYGQIDYFTGNITADGSYYNIESWEFRYHPITGQPYFVGSPDSYYVGYDDNSGNALSISGSVSPGDGDGRVILLYRNGSLISGVNIGSGTTYGGLDYSQSAPAVTPAISSYSGLLRNFSIYGEQTSPVKYSSTHYDYPFTDDNSAPYIIQHNIGAIGNANITKLIQNIPATGGQLHINSVTGAGTFEQFAYNYDGDTTITPNSIGWLANGTNLNITYTQTARQTINSAVVYSLPSPSASVSDPNDLNYYTVLLTGSAVSGSSYKWHRSGNQTGYLVNSLTGFTDSTVQSWPDNSTVTPLYGSVTARISERAITALTDPAIQVSRNTSIGGLLMFNDFMYASGGGVYGNAGRYGITSGGYFFIDSFNHGLEIGTAGSPHTYFHAPANNIAAALFNVQSNGLYVLQIKGSSVPNMFWADAPTNTIYLGNTGNNFPNGDPNAALAINPSGNDKAIHLAVASGANSANLIFLQRDNSNIPVLGIENSGHIFIGNFSNAGSGNLRIGGADNLHTQILLENTTTLPTTPVPGGWERYDNQTKLYWTDKNSVRRINLLSPTSFSAGQFMRVDSVGDIVTDNSIAVSGGILSFNGSNSVLFGNGFSVSSGKIIILGAGSNLGSGGGSLWYDTTQVAIRGTLTGSALTESFVGCIFTQTASGTVANSTSELSLDSTGVGTKTLPANTLTAGKTIRVKAWGFYSAVLAPTLRIKVKLGSTVILDTTAVTVANNTNGAFMIEGDIICRTTGASGTVIGQGIFETLGAVFGQAQMVNTGTITLATNTGQALTVTAQWGTASASNTITLTNLSLELLN